MKIEGCVYPDCFHCRFHDCMAPAVCFPGESKANEEAAGFKRSDRSEKYGKQNHTGQRGLC